MNIGWRTQGYTIVELMIFLAISGVLLASALTLVSGQQQKTEFSQAVNDAEQQINDVMNNVATGYYGVNKNFSCDTMGGGPPTITAGTIEGLGESDNCVFMGRALSFNGEAMSVINIVGRRVSATTESTPTNIDETQAVAMDLAGTIDTRQLKYGLSAKSLTYDVNDGTGKLPVGAFGFFSTLSSTAADGSLESGNQKIEVRALKMTSLNKTGAETAADINTVKVTNANSPVNPANGIELCLNSGGTNKSALITIGGSGRGTNTKLEIRDGKDCPTP